MQIYGVLDRNNCHLDVSTSIKGTKRVATIDGYKFISVRNSNHYYVTILFEKVGKRWIKYQN